MLEPRLPLQHKHNRVRSLIRAGLAASGVTWSRSKLSDYEKKSKQEGQKYMVRHCCYSQVDL